MDGPLPTPVILAGLAAGWLVSGGLLWKNRRLGLIAASLMGLALSLYLGVQHLADAGSSICSVSSTFDCDKLNRSSYAELFGIPIAFLGSGFYAAVLGVSAMGLARPAVYQRSGSLVMLGGAISVLYSLFLAWASTQLGAWCLFCIGMYGVNALILAGGWLSRDPEGLGAVFTAQGDRSMGAMLTSGLVVFLGAMVWYNSQQGGVAAVAEDAAAAGDSSAYAQLMSKPEGPLVLDGTEPVLGDPNAPYTAVEFADFQCPACAQVTPMMHELVARNPDIQVKFKHYPLSGICNPMVQGERHKDACRAAKAAECARQQDKFWDLSHLMFKNQGNLDQGGIDFMANQVGIDAETFAACLADPATDKAVLADIEAATTVGVHGTPSIYLQGTHGNDWVFMAAGPEGAELLVRAHARGIELPPVPAADHGH